MLCSESINGLKLLGGTIADFVGYMFSLIIGGLSSEEKFHLHQEQCGNNEYSQAERFRA